MHYQSRAPISQERSATSLPIAVAATAVAEAAAVAAVATMDREAADSLSRLQHHRRHLLQRLRRMINRPKDMCPCISPARRILKAQRLSIFLPASSLMVSISLSQ